jgi:hypothetical protein
MFSQQSQQYLVNPITMACNSHCRGLCQYDIVLRSRECSFIELVPVVRKFTLNSQRPTVEKPRGNKSSNL